MNLLSNATKFTRGGGNLMIAVRLVRSERDLPAAPSDLFYPAILVVVHDTGMGIHPDDQPLLFNRFYRSEEAARRQVAGTGLGLTIVKSLIELHGGHVWFKSELEQGSSFYFTIPVVEG